MPPFFKLHIARPHATRWFSRLPFYYGWIIAVVATLGVIMSIPGQTMGVSVFTDPLLGATGLSRTGLSLSYLAGTLLSATLLPWGGSALDRFGAKLTATSAALGLGATLLYFSALTPAVSALGRIPFLEKRGLVVPAVYGLTTLGFLGLRFSGQGMLTMVSRALIGRWFQRRRGLVTGVSNVLVSFGFASAPLMLNQLLDAQGLSGAFQALAVVVALGMGTVAFLFFESSPESVGLAVDGGKRGHTARSRTGALMSDNTAEDESEELTLTRDQAIRTRRFWAVTLALASQALIITGVTFHIVDIGRAENLTRAQAVGIFLPMAAVSTVSGSVAGIVSDRIRVRPLILLMMAALVAAALSAPHMGSDSLRMTAIAGLGVSGGLFGTLATVVLPRYFGRAHLGAISGAQMTCMVVASAIGPAVLATGESWSGGYALPLGVLVILPILATVLSLASYEPPPP